MRHPGTIRARRKGAAPRGRVAATIGLTLTLLASSAGAQVIADTNRGIVAAHDGRIELLDPNGTGTLWSAAGVEYPSRVVVSERRVAVLDALSDELAIAELASGAVRTFRVGSTPVDALFADGHLFVVERDSASLERISADGGRASLALAPDAAFLRAGNGKLYVYSRRDGVVQEIDPTAMHVERTLKTAAFASDFETDGRTGYLVSPRDARLHTFALATMTASGDIAVGAVPVDLAVTSKAGALSASRLAVADPSARRVWIAEGRQSVAAAFTRGFIRGLLGLGLFAPRSSDFPTGIDTIVARGSLTVAFDSATGTLYRLKGSRGTVVARDVAPGGFALTGSGIAVWQNGRAKLIR